MLGTENLCEFVICLDFVFHLVNAFEDVPVNFSPVLSKFSYDVLVHVVDRYWSLLDIMVWVSECFWRCSYFSTVKKQVLVAWLFQMTLHVSILGMLQWAVVLWSYYFSSDSDDPYFFKEKSIYQKIQWRYLVSCLLFGTICCYKTLEVLFCLLPSV